MDALRGYDRHRFVGDFGAGLTVSVLALPLAMAFEMASGLKPDQGVIAAIAADPDLGAGRLGCADRRPGRRLHRDRLRMLQRHGLSLAQQVAQHH